MQTFFFILIMIAAIATLVVLVRGVLLMASGKDVSGERQNNLMIKRVGFQAATIVLVILFMLFMNAGR